jgi:hypothetical protein
MELACGRKRNRLGRTSADVEADRRPKPAV